MQNCIHDLRNAFLKRKQATEWPTLFYSSGKGTILTVISEKNDLYDLVHIYKKCFGWLALLSLGQLRILFNHTSSIHVCSPGPWEAETWKTVVLLWEQANLNHMVISIHSKLHSKNQSHVCACAHTYMKKHVTISATTWKLIEYIYMFRS